MIETFQVLDGTIMNGKYHEARMNRSRRDLFGLGRAVDLASLVSLPEEYRMGRIKARIIYDQQIHETAFAPYLPRRIRTLRLVESDIAYHYKFEDRSPLEALHRRRDGADDVLIIKNGLVTDTTFSNIAFYNGTHWLTPATPLLHGTCRQRLLDLGFLRQEEIRPSDIGRFRKACLINALLDLGESEIPVENIAF